MFLHSLWRSDPVLAGGEDRSSPQPLDNPVSNYTVGILRLGISELRGEDRAPCKQAEADEQVAVLGFSARQELEVVGHDHDHAGDEHGEHRRRDPERALGRFLLRQWRVARALALRAGHAREIAKPEAQLAGRVTVTAAMVALPPSPQSRSLRRRREGTWMRRACW